MAIPDMPTLNFEDYQVAWIAPLPVEQRAALYMLDEIHDGEFESDAGDDFKYIGGEINGHKIIVATLPPGTQYGGNSAASLVSQVKKCMKNSLWFGLLVGIAAGIPNLSSNPPKDIRLGDVLVSLDEPGKPGVVQHDMGRKTDEGFETTSQQAMSISILRSTIGNIRALVPFRGHPFLKNLERVQEAMDDEGRLCYRDLGQEKDILYTTTAEGEDVVEPRSVRAENSRIQVWYGRIGSGNTVMKSSQERDKLRDKHDLIGLEMEAHGTINTIPVGHIRGVCDYADKHKNWDWQGFAAATAAAYAREVLCSINPRNDVKVVSLIPFQRNKNFVGRETTLREIEKQLASDDSCERLALYGLGGCGKTAIALEFAYITKEKTPKCSIFWVPAINKESFEKAYLQIGKLLQIPGISDPKSDVKQLVQNRLSDPKSGEWLLVVDNADDIEVLFKKYTEGTDTNRLIDYLPTSPSGSILFTTRTRKAAFKESPDSILNLHEMNLEEAKNLLESTLSKNATIKRESDVAQLLELLTFLPLAIIQAASYINQNAISISEYITIYQGTETETIEVLEEDFDDLRRYPELKNPIATTWFISFEQIRKNDTAAADYLSFMACLLRENIWVSLLPPRPSPNESVKALGTLKAYSFITKRKDEDSYDMHRLVYLATRNWLKPDNHLHHWTKVALDRLENVLLPNEDLKDLEIWRAFLPHAICIAHSPGINPDDESRVNLLFKVGECQMYAGQFKSAQTTFSSVLYIKTKNNQKEHPKTLVCVSHLAYTFGMDGKYSLSETLNREVLDLRKKVLGQGDRETLRSMNNLGVSLENQGKHAEAEFLLGEALTLGIRSLGKEDPVTLLIANNFATNKLHQGKYPEAEKSYRELLSSRKNILGEDHPGTIITLERLAGCLQIQGNLLESEELFRTVVELSQKRFGKEHPETLLAVNSLIQVQIIRGGSSAHLEIICKEQWASCKRGLGEEHGYTLKAMRNLTWVFKRQKRYVEAEVMYRKLKALQEKGLGKQHPDTLTATYELADFLTQMGNLEGDVLHLETLALRERVSGSSHDQTLISVSKVAEIREKEGDYEEAFALYQRALEGYRNTFGEQHRFTRKALRDCESFLERRGFSKERRNGP